MLLIPGSLACIVSRLATLHVQKGQLMLMMLIGPRWVIAVHTAWSCDKLGLREYRTGVLVCPLINCQQGVQGPCMMYF